MDTHPQGCRVAFHEVDWDMSTATTFTDSSGISDDTSTQDINLAKDVCNAYRIDLDTLYIQAASHCNAVAKAKFGANKEWHLHWKPLK